MPSKNVPFKPPMSVVQMARDISLELRLLGPATAGFLVSSVTMVGYMISTNNAEIC